MTAPDGYEKYTWSNGATGQRIALNNFSQSGEYFVNVSDNNGCSNVSNTINVEILRAPTRPNISLRGTDTLRSSAIGGVSIFQWYWNGNIIPGATQREYVATVNGDYTVMVTNDDGCTATSNAFTFTGGITSVNEELSTNRIMVTPNPFEDQCTVTLPQAIGRVLRVVDLTGAVVNTINITDDVPTFDVDLSTMARGTYLIQISAGSSVWSTTAVKR